MNTIGRKLAYGVLGTILTITPVAKLKAQKTAVSAAGKLHTSTIMATAGDKLKGLRTDVYNASKNIAADSLKAINTEKAAEASTGIKNASLIKQTQNSNIFEVTKESLLDSRVLDVTKDQRSQFRSNLLSDPSIKHVKMAIPKNERYFSFDDIAFNCELNKDGKTNLILKGGSAVLADYSKGVAKYKKINESGKTIDITAEEFKAFREKLLAHF